MKTAVYTICKNEINRLNRWLEYGKLHDYMVVLDTGSTDGTWEALQAASRIYPNLIIEQKIFTPWKFNIARNYNLEMIPQDVEWCLSPDLDEFFSINVRKEIEKTVLKHPNVTNIATTRLDIYSEEVFVGERFDKDGKNIGIVPTNKIHRRHTHTWRQPIYEHLFHKDGLEYEVEITNDKIFLIHDQETDKPRSTLYPKMMWEQYEIDPTDSWNSWYLLKECFREKDMPNFIRVALDFIKYHHTKCDKYNEVRLELVNIAEYADIPDNIRTLIRNTI